MTSTYWTGTTSKDFYDASNWSTDEVPSDFHDVDLEGSSTAPVEAIASTASSTPIPSLTIGDDATLDITAHDCSSSTTPVFEADAMQIFETGTLTVDTSSDVELGINEIGGTVNIINNGGNTHFTTTHLSGDGNLNLVNSTVGSDSAPLSIDSLMKVSLTKGSTLYTGSTEIGSSITFDSSKDELVLDAKQDAGQTLTTAFYGVSANTEFAVNGTEGVKAVSANYTENSDGTYTLSIGLDNNQTITLDDIHTASGFTPGSLTITTDKDGNYVVDNASSSGSGSCTPSGEHHHGCGDHTGSSSSDSNSCQPSGEHHHHDSSSSSSGGNSCTPSGDHHPDSANNGNICDHNGNVFPWAIQGDHCASGHSGTASTGGNGCAPSGTTPASSSDCNWWHSVSEAFTPSAFGHGSTTETAHAGACGAQNWQSFTSHGCTTVGIHDTTHSSGCVIPTHTSQPAICA
ncbi:hypothetical protein [Acetobacter fallax]|uniref:Uncharacterized protein n=1 Tax=Acetobacter fallax TaxID=1737473 RepID=A0ABX0K6D5_9PROT|nr:hypothetical protein [Acetobacter fallax]NHO31373.1 hypothetical protein [Acetobacter fallax]NHO35045.1 hypothetical protein [Acetobacter fallax]